MRQHVLKGKEEIIKEYGAYIVQAPKERKGCWNSLFSNADAPLYIEIGSGKGQFITQNALLHPDRNYLACEGAINIYPRILQKLGENRLSNALLISEYIINPADYFEPGELAGLYLNFSDPWPKTRDAHRRLTYVDKLNAYKEILCGGATLEFKTDNDELFEFSLRQAELARLPLAFVTRDLHSSEIASENVETEYEQKFSALGKNINYFKIVF